MMAVVVTYSSFAGYLKDTLGKLKFASFWGVLYASNWYQLLIGQSYGEDQGRPPLLRHMWSLAVEEQFYLIWPLVMVFVMARYRRRLPKVAGAFLGIGVALSVIAGIMFAAGVDWNWMYLGTQSRASGLLLGAGMAIMWRPYAVARSPLRNRGGLLSVIGIVGLGVLILAFVNFRLTVQTADGEVGWKWLWYGGMLLVDVATMCVIASATHFRSFFGQKVLGAAPLVWIGVRSLRPVPLALADLHAGAARCGRRRRRRRLAVLAGDDAAHRADGAGDGVVVPVRGDADPSGPVLGVGPLAVRRSANPEAAAPPPWSGRLQPDRRHPHLRRRLPASRRRATRVDRRAQPAGRRGLHVRRAR